ncbi:MAG: hypothetical protein RIQ56_483 [Candidatus Parcubacteria bacterium]
MVTPGVGAREHHTPNHSIRTMKKTAESMLDDLSKT